MHSGDVMFKHVQTALSVQQVRFDLTCLHWVTLSTTACCVRAMLTRTCIYTKVFTAMWILRMRLQGPAVEVQLLNASKPHLLAQRFCDPTSRFWMVGHYSQAVCPGMVGGVDTVVIVGKTNSLEGAPTLWVRAR